MFMNIVNELSRWAVPSILFLIPLLAYIRKVKVYETFVDGAQEGFNTAIKTIPFLVAMMVAIGVFRASGAMELMENALSPIFNVIGFPSQVLPLAIMRPLSGGGALGISSELIKVYGPDSFIGRLASTMQGSTDTTFFILTLYFGSVGIKKYRYSPISGLAADLTGLIASIYIVNLVFNVQ